MKESFKFYNNENFRNFFYQFLIIAFISSFLYFIFSNMLYNMSVRRIKIGFDFLSSQSGFGIIQSLIDYNESSSYGRTFFVGLLNTILVSSIGIVMAVILGFIVGIGRLSSNWLTRKMATIYIEVFRNLPILLQILVWNTIIRTLLPRENLEIFDGVFISVAQITIPELIAKPFFYIMVFVILPILILGIYFLKKWAEQRLFKTGKYFPIVKVSLLLIFLYIGLFVILFKGIIFTVVNPIPNKFNFTRGIGIIPEIFSLSIALAVYTATYIAEAVRSGIQSVPKGQIEAAEALGLKEGIILKLITIPQAMRVIIPPSTNQFLNLVKNSSLATAIGYPDLVSVFAGTTLSQVGQAVEIMMMTMAVYLLLNIFISIFMNWYNAKVKLETR